MSGLGSSWNSCDVLIAGGGPAGLSAAIALAERGFAVTVVDPDESTVSTRCEMLPPAAGPVIGRLGIADIVRQAIALEGVTSHWGVRPRHEDAFRHDGGWSVERRVIEGRLRSRAERLGARLCKFSVRSLEGRPGAWRIRLSARDVTSQADISCRYLVDATGRRAVVARRLGARLEVGRDLVALLFKTISPVPARLLAEATPDGWWYSLPCLEGGGTIGYVTSAKLANEMRKSLSGKGLDDTERLVTRPFGTASTLHDSRCSRLSRCSGTGWIAAGDAASAFDPISSQGLFNALSSGFFAGNAAADALYGNQTAPDIYQSLVERTAARTYLSTPWQYAASRHSTAFWSVRSKPVFPGRGVEPHVSAARKSG